jgi:hypothetical protein
MENTPKESCRILLICKETSNSSYLGEFSTQIKNILDHRSSIFREFNEQKTISRYCPFKEKRVSEKVETVGLTILGWQWLQELRHYVLHSGSAASPPPPSPLVLHILHITDCPQLSQIWREETISIGDSQRHVSSFPP